MTRETLSFLIGARSIVAAYPGVATAVIDAKQVTVTNGPESKRVLQEEEDANAFASSTVTLSISSSSAFVSSTDPPLTIEAQEITIPLLSTVEPEEPEPTP